MRGNVVVRLASKDKPGRLVMDYDRERTAQSND